MTSYNPLNGYWTASNYDLVTTILRGQWCYTGIVMSDWWADGNDRDGAGSTKHVAAMVRAQNDVFMVVTDPEHNSGSDDLAVALTEGRLDPGRVAAQRGEYPPLAANTCVPPQHFATHGVGCPAGSDGRAGYAAGGAERPTPDITWRRKH